MKFHATLKKENNDKKLVLNAAEKNGNFIVTLPAETVKEGYERAVLFDGDFTATEKDEGYFIIPDLGWSRLVNFKESGKSGQYLSDRLVLRMFCFIKNDRGFVGTVTGMRDEYLLFGECRDGSYRYHLEFPLEGRAPYEDIQVVLHPLEKDEADYNGAARWYRNYCLQNEYYYSLNQKAAEREAVKYACASVYVRIRMAWKPAPSPVPHQTPENEPPMHVACYFKMVEDLIDEMKAAGIDKAELCLVGWNYRGHDGRWPQMFPVEPELGGEEGLISCIKKAKVTGYTINLHTNFTDAYEIAHCFSFDDIIVKKDGSYSTLPADWSGGRPYRVALPYREKAYINDLKKLQKFGLNGLHYCDVITIVPTLRSYSKTRPMTPKDYREAADHAFHAMQKYVGGSSSEGVADFGVKYLDYGFYAQFEPLRKQEEADWMDDSIPLVPLVLHGTVLYNASARDSVNYCLKTEKERQLSLLYGARPTAYCFVDFLTSEAVWGKEDLVWNPDEKPKKAVAVIKALYEDYKLTRDLSTVFMQKHEFLPDGSQKITYEDGSTVRVNFETGETEIHRA